jgi:hypothetical protein
MIVVEVESVDFHSIIIENVPYVITTIRSTRRKEMKAKHLDHIKPR